MAINTGLFDGDDSDIVVDQGYFGTSDATANDDIPVSPGYFGGEITDDGSFETYTLVEENNIIYLRRDSDGTLVEPGVPAGSAAGAAFQIGFLPPGHEDHSGGENDGEIILGDDSGNIISALPVDVRANGTIIDGDNGLIGIDNGRVVLNVSTLVQASDNRPVTSDAVQTALDNLPAGHSDIGGILSISSTPDKVAEIGIYDTDSARIGQQFVISTVDTVNDIQDININSEPSAGTSTTQLAQRLELSLNKATAATAGDNRPITSSAVHSAIAGVGGSDVAPFQAGVPYAAGENFTNLNKLYAVNGATEGFANIAAAISNSTLLVDGDVGGGDVTNAVLYTPQTLSEAQKEQARDNIDAAGHLSIDSNLCLELANDVSLPAGFVQPTTSIPGTDIEYNLVAGGAATGSNVGDYIVYIQDGQTEYSVFELVALFESGGNITSLFLWITSGAGTLPSGLFTLTGDLYRPANNFSSTSILGDFQGTLDTVVAKQIQFSSFDFTLEEQAEGIVFIEASPTLGADDVPAIVLDSNFADATDITPTAATFSTGGNLQFTEDTSPAVNEIFKLTFTYGTDDTVTFAFSGSDVEFTDFAKTAWLIHGESLNVTAGTRPTVGDEAIELTHSGTSQKITFNNGPVVLQGSVNRVTGTDNVFNVTGGGDATNAVLYTAQTLTEAQKEIARNNIDAAGHLMLNGDLSLELADGIAITGTIQPVTVDGEGVGMYDANVGGIPGATTGDYLIYIQDGQTEYSIFQVVLAAETITFIRWITSGAGTRPNDGGSSSEAFSATIDLYRAAANFTAVSTRGVSTTGENTLQTASLIAFREGDFTTDIPSAQPTWLDLRLAPEVIRDGDFTVTNNEVVSVNIEGTPVPFPSGGDTPATAVLYTSQTLTNAQQIQARANIAASRQTELWATGQDYVVGDNVLVVFSGDIIGFACLQAHTSDNTPGGTGNGQPRINVDNSNWQQIGFQNIIPWVTGFAWQTGDVVLYRDLTPNNLSNSGLYIRRAGGVDADSSQNPFVNTADWLPLGGSGGGIEVLSSDPSSPTDGQVWYNSSQEIIKYFDGELTLDIAKFLGYFSTDPTHSSANHSDGDMWYNTTENEFKYFSGSGVVHTVITNLDSITALSDGQAVLDSIATETSNREAADTTLQNNIDAEATARIAGDEAERDYVDTTLHVDPADSQSYYQFSGQPAIFSEVPATDYGITIAMPQTITDTEELVQAETIGETTKVFKLTLRYGDGANDTKQYVVTTGGYNFTISDERTSETFRLPSIEGTYVAGSVHINGTSTRRQDCFLAIGGWFGRIAQVDMAHVLNVSNGDILAGRTLELGQDYSEHIIADNNNTAVVGLVFDNQTTGSHTGINAYALQRRNRIVRYRAATSGGLFSFRNGNSVVDRFNPSRVPDVVSQQTVDESNWLGLKLVTIQNAISGTSAGGDTNRLTFAVSDKMLTAFGEATDSASAGISIPGIAVCKNPSTFDGGSVNLGLFYPGGNDPSEEYSDYSSATEANYNAHIYDFEYSNASGAWTFFFGGQTVGETAIATSAAGFHGTSIWNMASISTATKAGAGGIIRSVNLGGNIAGLASDTNFWVTTELGALWVSKTPWLATGYGSNALVQAHTNPNDPTSDIKRDFTFRGFQYFDQHGSIGAGDDGHIYRLVINPEVTFTVTFGNVTHTARYRFNDDTAAMHTFFGNPASYSPTLAGTGVSLITTAPGGEPADQLYLDYSVNGQNTPVVSYQWVGVLSTTDDDFETYSPFRRIDLANTVVDIHYPDGGATYHIPMSSNINDYTVGGEANGAVDQMVAAVNTHTAQGHSAVRVDAGFADTITNTKPVLRLDQTGTHALQNAPTITIAHPSGQNTGTLAVESFADGGYDTIGRPGGLFDPNNYDTRAETDAKIAAIASTHGYAENIVPNAGTSGVTYPRYSTLQVGTEIGRMDYTGEEMVTAINGQSTRIATARIGTGVINNSELNTLNGIDTSQTIQTQLNAKQATVSVTGSVGDNIIGFTADSSGNLLTLARGTTTAVDTTLRVNPDSAITPDGDVAWDLYVGENLGYTKTSVTYQPNLVASEAQTWNPLLISASGSTGNFVISNVPFTLDVNSRYVAQITTPSGYNGTVEFDGADVTVGGGSGFGTTFTFDVLDADTSFSPALTPTDFVSASGNTISMSAVTGGTETNIVGNVIITGPGVDYNTTTGALTISGGGVTDAFRYSQLLTGGFLVQRSAAMDTATRRAYTDTQGAYGTANTTYYYEATSKSWFDVASGGTALISFPST